MLGVIEKILASDKKHKGKVSFRKNRNKLLALEREGKFVFHGSPDVIDTLEPRQAYNYDEETGRAEKDGKPAVFATPYAEASIFRALVNPKDVLGNSKSSFGTDGKQLHFSATKNLLGQAKKKVGRVYVLDKQKFKNFEGVQCRSEEAIVPLEVIEVTAEDLPENIELIEN